MSVLHHSLGQLPIVLLLRPQLFYIQLLQFLLLLDYHTKNRLLMLTHLLKLRLVIIAWALVGCFQVAELQTPKVALVWCFLLPDCDYVEHLNVLRMHHLLQLLATASLATLLKQTLFSEIKLILDFLVLDVQCFYLSLELKDDPLFSLHFTFFYFDWVSAFLLFICEIAHFFKITVVNLLHISLFSSLVLETLRMQRLRGQGSLNLWLALRFVDLNWARHLRDLHQI